MEQYRQPPWIGGNARRLLDEPVLKLLDHHITHGSEDGEVLFVSGKPLHVFRTRPELTDLHFAQCAMVEDLPITVNKVWMHTISRQGHPDIPEEYLCDSEESYPAISCFDFDGNEVVFGIRASLAFDLRVAGEL